MSFAPSRRDCLQLGLGTFFGGGLVASLRARGLAAEAVNTPSKAKGCILVWQDGGPSHYESFDPKPNAPAEIRGSFTPIATRLPGVQFSEHMTKLAGVLDKFSVVRSIRHNQGNHGAGNHYMMTGAPPRVPVGCGAFVSFHPSIGSVVSHERGAPAGLPAYFSTPSMSRSGGANFLGARHAPFVVGGDPNSVGFRVRDVALPETLTGDRFLHRCEIRAEVDTFRKELDKTAADPAVSLDEHYQQAYDLMNSKEAQAAFDIAKEPDATRDKFGRNPFGQRCLLARRLVEAGVPFITVYDGGWDDHVGLFESYKKKMPTWDSSMAALISDLHDRGMLESTLVIALGEFGRTPQVNKNSGRDHWSNAMSVLFAGGGTPGGQIIGATDKKGYAAVQRVLSPENFVSTIYTKLGIDPGKILYTPQGRPTHIVSDHTPIRELMG